jgi:hypothetical protein
MWIESIVFCAAKKITHFASCTPRWLSVVRQYILYNTNPDAQDNDVRRRIVAAK